ncbi:MAG TPA: DNA polymerase III subunit alpha [Steroidobacteraceae bacterium]|nr:DNA polymerase III subunit alpha [Steroidobacteraceae bacterium]
MSFVHLHLHTEYSLVDSVIRIQSERDDDGKVQVLGLMDAVAATGMPAVALTDQSNLFAMVKFYKAAQSAGIKPIIGVDLLIREEGDRVEPSRLVLLCQNEAGYKNATRLISDSYLRGQHKGVPLVHRDWLTRDSLNGLIALAGPHSDLGRLLINGRDDEAGQALEYWQQLFAGRFYIELLRTGRANEEQHLAAAVDLAMRRGLPVIASNDVRFIAQEDFESHEARVCIHDGTQLADANRVRRYSDQQYLKTPQQMAELFADLPEALQNTVELAKRCNLEVKLGKSVLPAYPVPAGMTTEDYLRQEAVKGLQMRLEYMATHAPSGGHQIPQEQYHARLQSELDVICKMGFAGYFLIVADFIQWSKDNDIPVGPGRGSGAGSLVAYSIKITDIDPLQYGLLFERFLNPERVSMPDFDIDFCMDNRDRVIEYVAQKYGRERVSQIITYGSMAAKAVVRDVARVMGQSYGFADSIAKLIPFELGITLKGALEKEEELRRRYKEEEDTRAVLDLALSLEGLVRNAGMHAGGVVISPTLLTDFAPLYCDEDGQHVVTQFDKDDVEAAGLVKFDFLGLRTLTIIDWAVKTINAEKARVGEAPLEIDRIPLDDAMTYDRVFKEARTTAIFQFESGGMQRMLKEAKPDRFEDLIALGALYRPGPMDLIPSFVARKHGREPVEYPDRRVEPVLKETYGIMVYQEQVMQMAQIIGGYTLGGADLLRRAMGKKKPEEMVKHRAIFREGAAKNGCSAEQADAIFDLMEKFAGYGFNKSHAAAYALVSYQTAWLKAHYPEAFMAAVLSSDMDNTDKVAMLIDEVRQMGLKVEPPDVNQSHYMFTVSGKHTIRYGLGAIKGVGQGLVDTLVTERETHGAFRSLTDLCERSDAGRMNKRVLEALIKSGALDSLGANRATLMHYLQDAMQMADQSIKARAVGQNDLFGLSAAASHSQPAVMMKMIAEWPERTRLEGERETLGLYLSGHPFNEFREEISNIISAPIVDLTGEKPIVNEGFRSKGKPVTVAGMIYDVGKRGNRFIFKLDDCSARVEATLFEEAYMQYKDVLNKGEVVLVEGNIRYDEFIDGWRVSVNRVQDIQQVRRQYARHLLIRWPQAMNNGATQRLQSVLQSYRSGNCSVVIHYINRQAKAVLTLPDEWKVQPEAELLEQLRQLCGRENVQLAYAPRLHS